MDTELNSVIVCLMISQKLHTKIAQTSTGVTGGGRGPMGQIPQVALFGGHHFGDIVLLMQHSYIFIRCGLHEFLTHRCYIT